MENDGKNKGYMKFEISLGGVDFYSYVGDDGLTKICMVENYMKDTWTLPHLQTPMDGIYCIYNRYFRDDRR